MGICAMNWLRPADWRLKGIFWFGCLLVIWLSIRTPDGAAPWLRHADKFGHFAAYGVLAFAGRWAFLSRVSWLIGFLMFLGLLMEVTQFYLPYRDFDWRDMLANCGGVLLGVYIGQQTLRWHHKVSQAAHLPNHE